MVNNAKLKSKPCIGVLMLNTRFPRFVGDVGNADSFDGPVLYKTVDTAAVSQVVGSTAISDTLLSEFIQGGKELALQGADVITTSCGFLHASQDALQANIGKPVVSSSLVGLAEMLENSSKDDSIGILTFDARALGSAHLHTVASTDRLRIVGMEKRDYFYSVIKNDQATAEFELMRSDALQAAGEMKQLGPAAVILECTNLSPFKNEIRAILELPVFDIFDALAEQIELLG